MLCINTGSGNGRDNEIGVSGNEKSPSGFECGFIKRISTDIYLEDEPPIGFSLNLWGQKKLLPKKHFKGLGRSNRIFIKSVRLGEIGKPLNFS